MRISRLAALAVAAALALVPAASASPQNPVARDVVAPGHARPIQHRTATPAAAQAHYYSSYGKPAPIQRKSTTADSFPWAVVALGLGAAAGAVALAVRSRRRVPRLRVSSS